MTYLIAFQANSRAVASVSVGWRLVTAPVSWTFFNHVLVEQGATNNTGVFCFHFTSVLSVKWQLKDTQVFFLVVKISTYVCIGLVQ